MAIKVQCPSFDECIGEPSGNAVSHIEGALDFAHPMDAGIIKVLNNKLVNELFEGYVNSCVDLQSSLSLATGFRVNEKNNPELYSIILNCAAKLNIPVPYVVISRSVSGINAQTAGTDDFAYIAISSLLNCLLTEKEQHFVLGHECGHIALGHVVYHTAMDIIGNCGSLIPVVGNVIAGTIQYPMKAWSRRSEISADRAGLICCGDINVAKKALIKLEAGFMNVDDVDIDEYLHNSNRFISRSALGKYRELFMEHPIIPKRIEALDLFANSEKYYRITGNPIPDGANLIGDKELEQETNKIIKILL